MHLLSLMQFWGFGSPLISSLPVGSFEEMEAQKTRLPITASKTCSHGMEREIWTASIQQLNLYPQDIKNCHKSVRKTAEKT